MADVEAKVNMSLDDIIKMEKKKKATNPRAKRGGGAVRGGRGTMRNNTRGNPRGNTRGNIRGNVRGNVRGNMRGNMRGSTRGRNNFNNNRRGQWKKYPQNNVREGFIKKRFNNGNIKSNLTRSRSNVSLNRMNLNNSPRSARGGFSPRRGGGKFGGLARSRSRSRSRTNLAYTKPTFLAKNMNMGGFLKRTTSMPNLRDPSSVHNRLGYQSPAQIAYRNRVKRAKNVLLQRQSKAMRMQEALSLSPMSFKNMSPLKQTAAGRQYNAGGLRSDQIMRAQRRQQYEQKLIRMGNVRGNNAATMNFMNSLSAAYNNAASRHPAMALYPTTVQTQSPLMMPQRQLPRGRSPFRQSLQNLKAATKAANRSASFSRQQQQQQQLHPQQQHPQQAASRRARSRSRSRPRNNARNNVISLTDAADLEDRSFSEVMYSLSNNFGVTGRTLNDRFSLF